MAISKFRKFETTYACRVCDRRTRNTGDEGSAQLCRQCFDLAGIENTISDEGLEQAREWGYVKQAEELLADLRSKGIDVDRVWASLIDALRAPIGGAL